MSSSKVETHADSASRPDILAAAHSFLAALPSSAATSALITEGREIAAIVEPLGLSSDVLAAVHVYPLVRDNDLDINSIENSELSSLSRTIIDMVQLGSFSLQRLAARRGPGRETV